MGFSLKIRNKTREEQKNIMRMLRDDSKALIKASLEIKKESNSIVDNYRNLVNQIDAAERSLFTPDEVS